MPLSRADVLTERIDVDLAGDGSMGAYLARPRDAVPSGGVLVAHELFGVTAHIRDVCERLASLGFMALAPDFYHRAAPGAELPHDDSGRERGFALLERLDRDGAIADVAAAVGQLRSGGASRVALLGLSLGGHIAYLGATACDVDAVAALYPGWLTGTDIPLSRPEPTLALTERIAGRVLLLCGEADHAVPAADLEQVDAALSRAAISYEIVLYPRTPHGFLCDRRDTFRAEAAGDAWARLGALFDETLN
jgi:carboxymethylenebutenolidase